MYEKHTHLHCRWCELLVTAGCHPHTHTKCSPFLHPFACCLESGSGEGWSSPYGCHPCQLTSLLPNRGSTFYPPHGYSPLRLYYLPTGKLHHHTCAAVPAGCWSSTSCHTTYCIHRCKIDQMRTDCFLPPLMCCTSLCVGCWSSTLCRTTSSWPPRCSSACTQRWSASCQTCSGWSSALQTSQHSSRTALLCPRSCSRCCWCWRCSCTCSRLLTCTSQQSTTISRW